jgi:hypothetical protein
VATAGDAFAVNLSQVLPLTQGQNYVLKFEASSDRARTMVAGIGLSVAPWTNDTKIVNLTTAKQTFTLELSAAAFGGANSRVIFDMGAAVGTVVIDNVNLVLGAPPTTPTAPTTATPTPPTRAAGDVISLFSGAYTNVTVDTWRTIWSEAVFEDVTIASNATKKYSALDFVGVETFNPKVDASAMTHVHVDVWSSDFTQFSLKLVNDATGAIAHHQVDYATPAKGEWVSYDIPLTSFTGLTSRNKLDQYIFVGRPIKANTIFIDNFYFYKAAGGGGGTSGTEVAVNGDFETGNKNGWTEFPNGGATFVVTNAEANGGTFSGRLIAGEAQDVVIKQANLLAGSITNGKSVTVKFDMKGSLTGAGGAIFAEFFSEKSGGGTSKTEFLGGPTPIAPTSNWTTYTYTTTTASVAQGDVGGGITLQLKAVCGAVAGCSVTAFFDNVSIKVNP